MSKEYADLRAKYDKAAAAAKAGDKTAMADKAAMMNDLRQMERACARSGRVLNPVSRGGKTEVEVKETDSRRSLQEEYVRKFNDKIPVEIENPREGTKFVGTLRAYHSKRLLGK